MKRPKVSRERLCLSLKTWQQRPKGLVISSSCIYFKPTTYPDVLHGSLSVEKSKQMMESRVRLDTFIKTHPMFLRGFHREKPMIVRRAARSFMCLLGIRMVTSWHCPFSYCISSNFLKEWHSRNLNSAKLNYSIRKSPKAQQCPAMSSNVLKKSKCWVVYKEYIRDTISPFPFVLT
jgi:hypothetical protein